MRSYADFSVNEVLHECERHKDKILKAKRHISSLIPLTESAYVKLDDVDESFIDQMIFRFSKLQDSMGEKLFPGLLVLSGEDTKRKTFIDILNRLEELEILSKEEWFTLREVRNDIAHEYSDNISHVIDSITGVYEGCDDLLKVYKRILDFGASRFPSFLVKAEK